MIFWMLYVGFMLGINLAFFICEVTLRRVHSAHPTDRESMDAAWKRYCAENHIEEKLARAYEQEKRDALASQAYRSCPPEVN
jgi:hypothetical protein